MNAFHVPGTLYTPPVYYTQALTGLTRSLNRRRVVKEGWWVGGEEAGVLCLMKGRGGKMRLGSHKWSVGGMVVMRCVVRHAKAGASSGRAQ